MPYAENKTNRKLAAIYSGGKDGHLSLLMAMSAGSSISCLITIDGGKDHSHFFHDLRKTEIIRIHAEKMDIPLVICKLVPGMRQGKAGTADMLAYLAETAAKEYSFDALCCGATDGDDDGNAESFRKSGIAAGIMVETPLAGLNASDILRRQENAGVRAIIVAAERGKLPESLLGMETGSRFASMLEKLNKKGNYDDGNDFQTIVTDSPLFPSPIEIKKREIIRDMERSYLKITV
ncbi:MAG: hypothetical protein J5706_07290 [Elusimicrobiales bacterium]|nr:hypothetical protein [Elusimicrobiales bacterium]